MATGEFDQMDLSVDEDEHSIEMHLPYIIHVMRGRPFTLVPILVGDLSKASQARYGAMLAPYLAQVPAPQPRVGSRRLQMDSRWTLFAPA